MPTNKTIIPGGVEKYIATFSKNIQTKLEEIRAVIKSCAVGSIETTSYFGIPGIHMKVINTMACSRGLALANNSYASMSFHQL